MRATAFERRDLVRRYRAGRLTSHEQFVMANPLPWTMLPLVQALELYGDDGPCALEPLGRPPECPEADDALRAAVARLGGL